MRKAECGKDSDGAIALSDKSAAWLLSAAISETHNVRAGSRDLLASFQHSAFRIRHSMRLLMAATAAWLLLSGTVDAAADYRGVTDAAIPGSFLDGLIFYIVAGGTVLSALGVCVSRNIVRMAVWLFITLGSVALMYFLLAANFLGAIQLIVYAGGTLVLLIFGVMLTSKSPWVKFEAGFGETLLAGLVCTTLLGVLLIVLFRTTWAGVEQVVPGAPLSAWGQELMTRYLVPFEVAGLLLMIVMVGAAHLARQEE